MVTESGALSGNDDAAKIKLNKTEEFDFGPNFGDAAKKTGFVFSE